MRGKKYGIRDAGYGMQKTVVRGLRARRSSKSGVGWSVVCIAALCTLVPLTGLAATVTWTGEGDGTNFHDNANWDGVYPGNNDIAVISSNNAEVTFTVDRTFEQLTMGDIGDFSQTLNILSGTMTIDGAGRTGDGAPYTNSVVGVEDGAYSVVNQYGGTVSMMNVGELWLSAESHKAATSIWNMVDGSLTVSQLRLGQRGTAAAKSYFNQSGGTVFVTNHLVIGRYSSGDTRYTMTGGTLLVDGDGFANIPFSIGRECTASFFLDGGAVTNYQGLRLGEWSSGYGQFTITNGHLYNVGGLQFARADSSGIFYQAGGITEVDNVNLNRGDDSSGTGTIVFSGGSFSTVGNVNMNDATGIVEVVGSGCTNISIGGDFDFNNGRTTLRASVDTGGLSLIKVAGDADLSTNILEVGIVTNGFSCVTNDTWQLIRVPEANTITTTDMSVVNFSTGYVFETSITTSNSYDWLMLTCTEALPIPVGGSTPLPFVETFEDSPSYMANDTTNVLHGQHGWVADGTNTALVRPWAHYGGLKAGTMTNSLLSHDFTSPSGTNVWVDFYARVPARQDAGAPALSSGSALGFYIDQNSHVAATAGDTWVTNTDYTCVNGTWIRFTANVDYIATNWSLYIAGAVANELATNLFSDLPFRSGATSNYLGKFTANGIMENTRIYLDNISMGRDAEEGKPSHIDTDGDQMADRWEIDRFGDITSSAGTNFTDGDTHNDLSEFIAGTDPTNENSYLHIVDVDLSSSSSSNITVIWEGGGYSVTSIYAGDSISRTYNLLASDNSYNATTSLVASVDEGDVSATTNVWIDANAADSYDSRFYNIVLADYGGLLATNNEDWAMIAQNRESGKRYMACVPVNYKGTNNNLMGELGQHLARGLYSSPANRTGDWIEVYYSDAVASTSYYWDANAWYTLGGTLADAELKPGQPFWVVRTEPDAQDRTNAVFAGQIWTESTITNFSIYQKLDATNGWNMIGWPLPQDKVVSRDDTSNNQLGFYAAGAEGALSGDWSSPSTIGDMIYIWRDGAWRQAWLIDGTGSGTFDGRWWDELAWDWLDWTFKPGEAFWYYHTENGNPGNFDWTPEP